jgi:hypothetical protein
VIEGENLLVGLVCLALVPLIALRIHGGLRSGRLPIYRTYLDWESQPGKFHALLIVHAISLALVAFIAADLLLGLGYRSEI